MNTSPALLFTPLERWAQHRPDDVAMSYVGTEITWAQWRDRVRRTASALRDLGIGRGDIVAFLDKNTPACLEVMFAASMLGAATAVLNWRCAEPELRYMVEDCRPTLLFAGPELLPVADLIAAAVGDLRVLLVGGPGDNHEDLIGDAEPLVEVVAEPADTCLIMYSSGTTGRPKGVMLTHRNLVAHTRNVGTAFPFTDGDASLVAMPLFHVGGTCYALLGIAAGVRSIMVREPDAASLLGAIAAGATHAFLVPPVIAGILAAGPRAVAAVDRLSHLGYGAAPMPLPLLRAALAAWPRLNFVQVYGQTELSGVVAALGPEAHRDAAHPERLGSGGTPVPEVLVRVVDPVTGVDVPTGGTGELWFRTEQCMRGYLHRPEATAEAVTADGWLRTGDVGHLDEGGFVYIEDRLKDMIITGGENVYCPEVERVLSEHPDVAEVAVIGVPDERWGEAVLAVVVARAGTEIDVDALTGHARSQLAGYKVPRTIESVAALPRNASGKILKRELREQYRPVER